MKGCLCGTLATLLLILSANTVRATDALPKSGYQYQSDDVRSLQDDNFANPGMFWVDSGKALFDQPAGSSKKSCRDCHQEPAGLATHFPQLNPRLERLVNLTSQIQVCRVQQQGAAAIGYESEPALALTSYLMHSSRGLSFRPIEGALQPYLKRGQRYYERRRGQMNIACYQCHTDNVGKQLRGDLISEGHSNGYPIYRLEWQAVGSLHRRLRACDLGVRAQPMPLGSAEYIELELYLRQRLGALPIESPAVRR
jgi:sulfur-oxidizing protein SoxA